MKNKLIVNNELVQLTPEILAELFAELDDSEQARFFNRVADVASAWDGGGLSIQMQYITDNSGLELKGRRVMQMIGDYSHWGLVPKCEPLTEVYTLTQEEELFDAHIHPVHGYE